LKRAIDREKVVKKLARVKKLELIEAMNSEWKDLFEVIKEW